MLQSNLINSREPVAIGYHGTRLEFARKIIDGDFFPSKNDWEWLGRGVYFWQDAPHRARAWAREWHTRKGYDGPIAVVAARIRLAAFVDLLDQEGMDLVKDFARLLQDKLTEDDREIVNKYPLHRLDCELFNTITTVLSSVQVEVGGYPHVSRESPSRPTRLFMIEATFSSPSLTKRQFWRNGSLKMQKRMSDTKRKYPNVHTSDGRISPDKAIALVTKIVKSKTPEEVRKIVATPVVLKGSDGKPLPERKT